MGKYRFVKKSELDKSVLSDDMWLRVSHEHDLLVGNLNVVRSEVCEVSNRHFDMVCYARDSKRNRVGVFVASDGNVGWSKVHPEDFRNTVINWEVGKDLAWSRAFFCGLPSNNWLSKVPFKIRSQFQHFVERYAVWYMKKNIGLSRVSK